MKTKIRRMSKRTLAMILGLFILMTCMVVGNISTANAATYYMLCSYNNQNPGNWSSSNFASSSSYTFSLTPSNFGKSSWETGINYYIGLSSSTSVSDMYCQSGTATVSKSGSVSGAYPQSHGNYRFAMFSLNSTSITNVTVTVTISGTTANYAIATSGSGGGGGGGTSETWTVAGSSAVIFGSTWTPSETSNDMTLQSENTYTKVYPGVTSIDGFEFKICKDHSWGTAYPGSNFSVTHDSNSSGNRSISSSGSSLYWKSGDTLTFTFDSSSKNITVSSETPETTHNVTFSAGKGGSISPNTTTAVGESTATTVTATANNGYRFSSWTNGDGITQVTNTANGDNQTQTITTKSSGTYTVKANFSKKSYTLTKGTESNGTFSMSVDGAGITSGASVEYDKTISVSCIPATGYTVSSVSCGSNSGTGSGTSWSVKMPASDATLNVTFTKKTNSISTSVIPSAGGSGWVGAASNTTYENRKTTYQIGDTVYLNASANDAYQFDHFKVTYGDGTTEEFTTNNQSLTLDDTHYGTNGSFTLVTYFVLKPTYPITLVTNDSAYGTLSSSPTAAYSGQSVTITINENTGTLSSISAKDADNGTVTLSGSGSTRTFTMPAKAVTVTAAFTAYSEASDFYYNSYGSNGQPASSRYGAQMTKAKINGETYSYYHVTGRTEADQLFTVSYQSPVYNSYNTYFEINSGWENGGVSVQFYATDGNNLGDWTNMEYDSEGNGKKKFKYPIPDGARKVQFQNNNGNKDKTGQLSLVDGKNAWYTSSSMTDVVGYNSSNPVPINFYENYNGEGKYTNNFSTGGFFDHGANRGEQHSYSKPKGLDESQRGDYYILVLYKNKTYTINGETHKVNKDPEIIWTTELPSETVGKVKVYAKDGSVRSDTTTSGTIGNTVITYDTTNYPGVGTVSTHSGTGNAADCDYQTAYVSKGSTVKITTTLENDFKSTHYVKAFMVNGKGAKFFTHSNDGVYTMEYTIPEDFEGKTLEVTPVYFLKNESDTVTFKIEGFDPRVQKTGKWGTTLFAYPFYAETVAGYQSAFYGYPGQPVVEDNGKYYIQIPVNNTNPADTNHTKVRGITLSNGYLDDVHKICESTNLTDHRQTYDYDDFYKIYNEKAPDNITFSFKYTGTDISNAHTSVSAERTAGHNPGASFTNQTTYSGWEDLKNYHGQRVNIFGEVLDNQETTNVLYIVSDGYWYNNAGSFGTEWNVYTKSGSNFTRIGTIVPSALTLNNADSFDKSAYAQYNDSTNGKHMLSSFKTFYNTLKSNYNNYRAEITYEHNILGGHYTRYNAVKSTTESGDDAAYRLDGRWTYSNDDDIINAKTQVRYLDTTHDDIYDSTEDTFADSTVDKPAGITTGAAAYFTNTTTNNAGASYQYKMATGEVYGDKTKNFTFATSVEATRTNNYVFKGWYLFKDGTYTKMDNASSPMNSNDTYVALYKQVNYSTITIDHQLADNSGAGETEVQVQVSGSSDPTKDKIYPYSSDAITAEVDQDSTVTVTLRSTSAGANTFNGWYGTAAKGDSLGNGGYSGVVDKATKQITIYSDEFYNGSTYTMKSKTYYSDFTNVTRQFKAVFHYTNRAGQDKKYTVKTLLDTYFVAAHPSSYSLTDTIGEGVTLKQWVKDSAPSMIDLYGKNIKWAMSDANMTSGFDYTNNRIDINSTTEAKTWSIVVETHSDGNVNNASTKHIDTKSNIPNNTYAEKSEGGYYTPENNEKFSYWSVFPLDLKTGNPKNNNELLRIYNYEFKVMITGNYYVKAIYTPGTVTKASVQEAVYSREVYDLDETGDTKKDDLYSDFIYSYMSERNSVELKDNENYLSGLAVEVSQGTKVPEGTSKAVDYSEYTFDSDNSNIESYVAAITASTANGAKIGKYTYTADGKSDNRSVYCYPISNLNYNNFNRGDFAIMYGSNQSWTKYIMKAYYYVKNKSTDAVQISEPVYFCLHNTKVTVFASSNTIVES